jgi:SAM-dependent methyltransferase
LSPRIPPAQNPPHLERSLHGEDCIGGEDLFCVRRNAGGAHDVHAARGAGEEVMSAEELERWNQRFSAAEYVFGTAPNAFLAAHAALFRPGQRALCVADGEGRNSVWLAEQGLNVTAFDFSPVALDKARRLAAERGVSVRYELASVEDWRWQPAQFDVVVAIFIQFLVPAARRVLFERVSAALKPAGLLLVEGYTPEQLKYGTGGPKQVDQLYTEALLRQAFASLEILELKAYEAELDEGTRHRGMSAVIDLVARKPA